MVSLRGTTKKVTGGVFFCMASNEHFMYVGPHRDLPDLAEGYEEFIAQSRDTAQFEGAHRPEGDELKLIQEVQAGMLAVAAEAGVSREVMAARLTKPQHHHLFPDQETYRRGVRGRWPDEYEGNGGKSHPQVGVMWRWRGKPNEDGSGIAHEGWHDVGRQRIQPVIIASEVIDGETHNDLHINCARGYTSLTRESSNGHGIEELIVEMSTDKTIHLTGLGNTLLGYVPAVGVCTY